MISNRSKILRKVWIKVILKLFKNLTSTCNRPLGTYELIICQQTWDRVRVRSVSSRELTQYVQYVSTYLTPASRSRPCLRSTNIYTMFNDVPNQPIDFHYNNEPINNALFHCWCKHRGLNTITMLTVSILPSISIHCWENDMFLSIMMNPWRHCYLFLS